jgi:hypothetical protein
MEKKRKGEEKALQKKEQTTKSQINKPQNPRIWTWTPFHRTWAPYKPYKQGDRKRGKTAQALEHESTKAPKHKIYKSQWNHWKTTATHWHPKNLFKETLWNPWQIIHRFPFVQRPNLQCLLQLLIEELQIPL